ncbi:MAG: hypothetical protein AAF623_05440 [Planctomycetota bacterium]
MNARLEPTSILGIVLVGFCCWLSLPQEPSGATKKELESRISLLESRLANVERVVFANAQLGQTDAKRRLADAERRLRGSRRLYSQGFINASQIRFDQLAVDRAKRELEMAVDSSNLRRKTSELEIANAKFELQQAERDLRVSETLSQRELIFKDDLERARSNVNDAQIRLELFQQKLKAATQLEAMRSPADKKSQTDPQSDSKDK